ncbi:hypothetical protein HKX48_006728 [Thoreauomyces humboldtii]|nr:hypothetical protein HKX48_006728 [Thoreauomyces humboldtii]
MPLPFSTIKDSALAAGPAPGFAPAELASDRASFLQGAILDSLAPPKSTDDREAQIPDHYAQTFSWAFDHEFGSWLTAREADLLKASSGGLEAGQMPPGRVFWINGLPGSGKSTLMRYIHQSPRLGHSLQGWTDQPQVASFFFWESGTILQRSQEGCARSLIAQLLSKCPSLIPNVFPALWSLVWTCDTAERVRTLAEWPLNRLLSGLATYFTLSHPRPPVLLLIDGLDELEGDPQVVLDLFHRISSCERVKICISSRPYTVFDRWFAGVPSIRLQDLTGADIVGFVRGRMTDHAQFGRMEKREQDEIVRSIQTKAEGVFLWAAVAMDVLAETDDVVSLLGLLPSSLDGLYRYRLLETGLCPVRLSRLLQLMRARQEVAAFTRVSDTSVMTVRETAIALDDRSADHVLSMGIEKCDPTATAEHCRRTASEVFRSSHGLLLVQQGDMPLSERHINYKHRTVKDWLVDGQVWQDVLALGPTIDAHAIHLAAILTLFKSPLSGPRRTRSINAWWPNLALCFSHARLSTSSDSTASYQLLLELNSTMSFYWPRTEEDPRIDSWARSCFGSFESRGRGLFEDPFLALTIRFGVYEFVRRYVQIEHRYRPGDGRSLLEHATAFLVHRQSTIYPLSDPGLVRLLLDSGCDVDHEAIPAPSVPGGRTKAVKTPWTLVLESIQQADRRGWIDVESVQGRANVDRWAEIVRMCMDRRAHVDVSVKYGWKDQKETTIELLKRVAEAHPYEPLLQLARLHGDQAA